MTKKNTVGRPKIKPENKKTSTSVSITGARLKEIEKHYKSLTKAIAYIPIPKPKPIESKPEPSTVEVKQKVAEPGKAIQQKKEAAKKFNLGAEMDKLRGENTAK